MSLSITERETLLSQVYDRAAEYEREYGYCPQAVLAAIQDEFGIVEDGTIQASHSLAGGGALCGDGTCGGLVGGMMAIASAFGRRREEFGELETEAAIKSSKLSRRLRSQFVDEYGSVVCRDVQDHLFGKSYDLWNQEEYDAFEDAGAHEDVCPDVTGTAARLAAAILLDSGVEPSS